LMRYSLCRLRDIKEMFMDTGVGADAYSLIEQGRVELFLQASQEERRAIFDEAAGISKYKARKKEALRKLERVEQNVLRLNDIIQEVDKRLRSIKYQAGKARSYQAYSERLKELRSLFFLARYHELTHERDRLKKTLDEATDSLAAISSRIDQLEAARSATELEAVALERSARDVQGQIASVGGQILTCQQRVDMLAVRVRELDEQVLAALARSEQLEAKIDAARQEASQRREQMEHLDADRAELSQRYKAAREARAGAELALARLRGRLEDERAGTIDLFRRTAQLHNEINGLGMRRENLNGQKQRLTGRAEEIETSLREMLAGRAELRARLDEIQQLLDETGRRLAETRRSSEELHAGEQALQRELSEARQQRSAIDGRIQTLREMQDRLEGVAAGARRVLEAVRAGRITSIRGMLGDFLQTDTKHAPLVEAALAGADQRLLAGSLEELAGECRAIREALADGAAAEVVCLDGLGPWRQDFDASALPGSPRRVIDFVRYPPELAPLVWRLLGGTLVVDSLAAARSAAKVAPPGVRFVTPAGEVLEADGLVRFGAGNRGAGVITRRSELAELAQRREGLDRRIERLDPRLRSARGEMKHLDELQQGLRTAIYEANTERVECAGRLERLDEEIASLKRERPIVAGDLAELARQIDDAVAAEHEARQKAQQLEELNRRRQKEVERLEEQIAQAAKDQDALAARMTEMKVALAAAEEKSRGAREAAEAAERRVEAMEQDLAALRNQVELDRQRKADAENSIAKAREEIDRLYEQQQQLNQESAEIEESRAGLGQKLEEIRQQLAEKRKAHSAAGEQVNTAKLSLGELDVRIEALITRAAEEMDMDLLALSEGYQHDEQRDWQAVEEEITQLRRKIERLGNVNLDAIGEQEQLQRRREFLGGQLADVEQSRKRLNELIRRINRESREMFLETFQAVRGHFQALFRKLFGGGRADIVLLDPQDVLETGIEIVARPPGKELRSLTLLSGGEKTMTALALLFSFFKCRPSPFCLLDEVDAALDEENTMRFARLVEEFMDHSQFLVISHAKRTMSMADVLYGVT
ncbi:MAG: chromosome segregation protein SMC, partial [Planctomycetes bacterium]|nr:chromosome segregation protein SMC [Planctomycetota bacterium]